MQAKRTTTGDLVRAVASQHPDADALLSHDAPAMSYRQLVAQIEEIRETLNNAGIGRGQRVALVCDRVPEAVGTYFGLLDSASVAPLNAKLAAPEFRAALDRVPFDAIVVHEDLKDVAELVLEAGVKLITMRSFPRGATGQVTLHGSSAGRCSRPGPVEPDDEGCVPMTTGTTGLPKGAIASQAAMAGRALVQGHSIGSLQGEAGSTFSPPYVTGLYSRVAGSLVTGGAILLSNTFVPERLIRDLEDFGLGWIAGGPMFLREILKAARADPVRASRHRLRVIVSSTTKLSLPLMAEIEETFGVPCIDQYSATETGLIAINPLPPAVRKPGTVGTSPHYELEIRDDADRPLPAGKVGAVVVRGDNLFSEYYKDPETTRSVLREGWFYTGDMGSLDAEGYLQLVGRKKELINRGGEKISPVEIEEALGTHPEVRDSICFAVPHATLGQVAAAAVVLKDGATATESDLKAYLRGRVSAFKVPTPLLIAADIPLGRTRKPDRMNAAEYYGIATQKEEPVAQVGSPAASQNGLEAVLAAIWAECLELPGISMTADFIESGGDSLQAMRLVGVVEEVTGVVFSVDVTFERGSTVAGMAELIRERRETKVTAPQPRRQVSAAMPKKMKGRSATANFFRDLDRRRRFLSYKLGLRSEVPQKRRLEGRPEFSEVRRRMLALTRRWPGDRLSEELPVFGVNLSGTRPPLIWCFNDSSDRVSILEWIEQDQPLIAIRSLNKILADKKLRPFYIDELARKYFEVISPQLGSTPAAIVGNCGAGPIAEALARIWIAEREKSVKLLLVEAEPTKPYPGAVHMLFGRESRQFNPFFARKDPVADWKAQHASADFSFVPGDHGEYFDESNVKELIRELYRALGSEDAVSS